MPYSEKDCDTMGRIADACLVDDVAELAKMLEDKELIAGLMVSQKPPSDADFKHRLELLIHSLKYVLDIAESTQWGIQQAKA